MTSEHREPAVGGEFWSPPVPFSEGVGLLMQTSQHFPPELYGSERRRVELATP